MAVLSLGATALTQLDENVTQAINRRRVTVGGYIVEPCL